MLVERRTLPQRMHKEIMGWIIRIATLSQATNVIIVTNNLLFQWVSSSCHKVG